MLNDRCMKKYYTYFELLEAVRDGTQPNKIEFRGNVYVFRDGDYEWIDGDDVSYMHLLDSIAEHCSESDILNPTNNKLIADYCANDVLAIEKWIEENKDA